MVVVKITNRLVELILQKGNKIPNMLVKNGLPKDAKLLDVKWDHYKNYIELCFETEESRNKTIELLPELEEIK